MTTHRIHMLLDRSGSMSGWRAQTIEAVNAYLGAVRADALAGETSFSLTIFDSESIDTVRRDVPGRLVRNLESREFEPRSATPLYDAMAWVLEHESRIAVGGRRAIVVVTDGEENGSRRATAESVRRFVAGREREGWAFIFLGANQDAQAEAAKIGVPAERAISYRASSGPSATATFAAAAAVTFAACMVAPGLLGAGAASAGGTGAVGFSEADRQSAFDGAADWKSEMAKDIGLAPVEPPASGDGWGNMPAESNPTAEGGSAALGDRGGAASDSGSGSSAAEYGVTDEAGDAAEEGSSILDGIGEAIGSIFSVFGTSDE